MTDVQVVAPIIQQIAALSECVCEHLSTIGAGEPCWCGVYAGQLPAWDNCDSCNGEHCGMGWVRVVSTYPADAFPNPVIDTKCVHELAWQVEVGAMRCIPVPSNGEALGPDEMADVWMAQMLDTWALYQAITCCGLPMVAVGSYTPQGPMGGCVGGYWTAWVSM